MGDKYPKHGDRVETPVTVVGSSDVNVISSVVISSAQSGTWTTGRTWTLNSGTDSVSASVTFPVTQDVNLTQISGAAPSVTNWVPARISNGVSYVDPTQIRALTSSDQITIANATLAVTQSGSWTTGRTWTLSSGTDSVTTTSSEDKNYGTVGASTLRTAAQIGNATGAADFAAGNSGSQTLRVVVATDQVAIPVSVVTTHQTRSDTYTVAASGTTVTLTSPLKAFAVQVKGTGAAASAWDVRLEGSLNGVNWTQILRHRASTGDGEVLFSGAVLSPILFLRSRLESITLGGASNIVVTILGMV